MNVLRQRKVTRFGLWRLGTEDETLWTFLGEDTPAPNAPAMLASVPPVKSVGLLRRRRDLRDPRRAAIGRAQAADGARPHDRERDVHARSERLCRRAHGRQDQRLVALTFDDGPDERNTGRMLDALHDLRVPAAFFVIGDQAMREPELVRRMAEEGHLVGNHSFTHPHMDTLTPREAHAELAATQRLIEGLTSLRTPLFRAPYTANIDPDRPDDIADLRIALQNGYLFVGAYVDPNDWRPLSADEIARRVVEQVVSGAGHIVLLHDGGGDRRATIAAVRKLVPELRKRGYAFVSLDKLLGLKREQLATSVPPSDLVLSTSDAFIAYARDWGRTALSVLFFACTVLSILRIVFLGALTLKNVRPKAASAPQPFDPLVTVIVPAFNEGKVIARTVRSLLASRYKNLEILVVDDGSTDDTAAVVTTLASTNPRVRLINADERRQGRGRERRARLRARRNRGRGRRRHDRAARVDSEDDRVHLPIRP